MRRRPADPHAGRPRAGHGAGARRVASLAVLGVVAAGVAAAALLDDDVARADVDLNDGGVWVTSSTTLQVGRVNHQVHELDGAVTTVGGDIDVLQDGAEVFVVDHGAATLGRVDVAGLATAPVATLPPRAEVGLGGDVLAVLDAGNGALRTSDVTAPEGLDATVTAPQAVLGPHGAIAVGTDGTVHALATPAGEVVTVPRGTEPVVREEIPGPDGPDEAEVPADGVVRVVPAAAAPEAPASPAPPGETVPELPTAPLGVDPEVLAGATNQITAVGTEPVVLSRTADARLLVLRPDEEPIDLTGLGLDTTGVRLQQVGPAADDVVLATADALVSVPLDGGTPRVIAAPVLAPPVAPLVVGECVHAAWAGGQPTYLRACEGSEPGVVPVPTDATAEEMRLRTNHGLVVLNDTLEGGVFLLDEQMTLVDDWDEVTPPNADDDAGEEPSKELTAEVPLERAEENRAPTAADDDLGVRPGATTVLEVLANDTDPDGDLLTVSAIDGVPDGVGTVVPVMGGRALQVQVGPDAAGAAPFGYTVTDGRGGEASATVNLRVAPRDVNAAPVAVRRPTLLLTAGATGSVDVLADVRDPDGDQLVLVDASWESEDVVRFSPEGTVTFEDSGVSPGPKQVVLTVSDGLATTDVVLDVDVRTGGGGLPPTAVHDHVRTTVDTSLVVSPLHNDTDTDGDLLRLANVAGPAEVDTVADYGTGTFQVRSATPGTHYLTYVVVDDSGQSSTGLVRVDVVEKATTAPVAMRDVALLPAGGAVTVDVVANDESPAGSLLAVQQVDVPEGSGLSVQVLEHRVLKISATQVPPGPVTVGYTVSGGGPAAQGEVIVQPVPAASGPQPPAAEPDVVNVRAGDVATVPVLENDTHPAGLDLRLDPGLVEAPDPDLAAVFTSGDALRFQAPDTPQTLRAVYRVLDAAGNEDSAQVTVHVQAATAENSAPQPKPVETRAFAGERIRIPVGLAGIDPDGDSVELLGSGEPPELGRIVEVGQGYLDYVAFDHAAGTDTFTYLVRDRLGLVAAAPLRVGVVPAPEVNRAPTALPDTLEVRPGRTVEVDVLANDSDPDGDPLTLEEVAAEAAGVETEIADGVALLTIGDQTGSVTVVYTVSDGRGESATGTLRVTVSDDAPLQPPTASDDVVAPAQIVGAQAVTVPVLANDRDGDGTVEALEVSLPDVPEGAAEVGSAVRVPVLPQRQLVAYEVTDADGLTGRAYVDVPGAAETGPVLREGAEAIEVRTGETVTIPLADHVVAPSGNPVRLTDPGSVQATNSDNSSAVVDAQTLTFTSASGYAGPASLTFEATDGTSAQDGLSAVLTLPITVLPDGGNTAPTLTGASLKVSPADGANTLNLAPLTNDPDPADSERHAYRVVEVPEGFEASLEGSFLTVTTPAQTPPGTVGDIVVSVADPVADPVLGTVRAEVVTSTRPLAVLSDVDLGIVEPGEPVTADVLAGAVNPFPETPLTVLSATTESGQAQAAVTGGRVVVTAANGYTGAVVVRATVQDATLDPARNVEARVRMEVAGVPDRPAPPRVAEVSDRAVVLSWTAPASPGLPVTGYAVTASTGATTQCASTTCTVSGLTNGTEYTFTVTATNDVGTSEPSVASAPARPDVRPAAPAAPTVVAGDGTVDVRWTPPTNVGSPVTGYDVQISPAVGSGQTAATTTAHTWTGLTNGQQYQVRVRAHNGAPEPSDWSAWSAGVVPAGVPDRPSQPRVDRVDNPVASQIRGTWDAPFPNGDPVSLYRVSIQRDGQPYRQFTTTERSFVEDAPVGAGYTVTVAAQNKAGWSPESAASQSVRALTAPSAPGTPTATATGNDGEVRLDFADSADNGERVVRYEVSVNGGGWTELGANRKVGGLTDGYSYSFRVRAWNTYASDPSGGSGSVVPYGPLGRPALTASSEDRSVTFGWSVDPNGLPLSSVEIRVAARGGGWSGWQDVGVAAQGSWTTSARPGTVYDAQVRVQRRDGAVTDGSISATTRRPRVEVALERLAPDAPEAWRCHLSARDCRYIDVRHWDLTPGTYKVTLVALDRHFLVERDVTIAGEGTYDPQVVYPWRAGTLRVVVEGQGVRLEHSIDVG